MPSSTRIIACIFATSLLARAPAQPDLTISDIWTMNGVVLYQIVNQGSAIAAPGHLSAFSVDGALQTNDLIGVAMAPGDRITRSFQIPIACSGAQDLILIAVDSTDVVSELDESNNALSEAWPCDSDPPVIANGVVISKITSTSAKLAWDTNEASSSHVYYDHRAGPLNSHVDDPALVTSHAIFLTGLVPYTLYRTQVESTDASGNSVQSEILTFVTDPETDSLPPSVSLHPMMRDTMPLHFQANASDDTGVDRVSFFLDGVLIETDTSEPFIMTLDPVDLGMTETELYREHSVMAVAHDRANRSTSTVATLDLPQPCMLDNFEYPSPLDGETIYIYGASVPPGTPDIQITAYAHSLDFGQVRDRWGRILPPNNKVDRIELHIDGTLTHTEHNTNDLTYDWSPVGQPIGDVDLRIKVYDGTDCIPISETHRLRVREYQPDVRIIARTVSRSGSVFNIALRINNDGTDSVALTSVNDSLYGFKAIPQQSATKTVDGLFDPESWTEYVTITRATTLSPHETMVLTYAAVPVMFPIPIRHGMGGTDVQVNYDYLGAHEHVARNLPYSGVSFESEVADAFNASNYLIVTSPNALIYQFADRPAYDLLNEIALLAEARGAVIGYVLGNPMYKTVLDVDDRLALGDIYGARWDRELYIADEEHDRIRVYRPGFTGDLSFPGLEPEDKFVMGNLVGELDGSHHPRSEIVIADIDGTPDEIQIYQFRPDTASFETLTRWVDWDPDYVFAVGDIRPDLGHPEDELIVLRPNGTLVCFYDRVYALESFSTEYQLGDLVTTGNISGTAQQAVVIGDLSTNLIRLYNSDGVQFETYHLPAGHVLQADDILKAGTVLPSSREQLVRMAPGDNKIYIYGTTTWSSELSLRDAFDMQLSVQDTLLVGDIVPTMFDEILIGRRRGHDHYFAGQVDVLTFESGVPISDRHALDALMNPGGDWAENMADDWVSDGYLLIVGESSIVPAFSNSYEISGDTNRIESTDNYYANTSGHIKQPELAAGRIIGNNPTVMRDQIQRTLDVIDGMVDFDQSDGLVVAGRNSGPGGGADWINFTLERWMVSDRLDDLGYSVRQLEDPSMTEFFDNADNQDLIHIAGHGWETGWDVVTADDVVSLFDPGASAPLVYANSCLTGKYTVWDPSLAERFIEYGASAYIGATEVSYFPYAKYLAEGFYDRFDVGTPAGLALKNAKRARMGDTAYGKYNSCIFHLFGDPMLQPQSAPKSDVAALDQVAKGPLASIQVTIPEFNLMSDGTDVVTIPGGGHLMEVGQALVPSYPSVINYPAGTQVQNVTRSSKSDLSYVSGLDLEIVDPAVLGRKRAKRSPSPTMELWPDRDFDWACVEMPDGSTNLVITTYPLLYSADTQEALFFQSHQYDIAFTSTGVAVRTFAPARPQIPLGKSVPVELILENLGAKEDLTVAITMEAQDGSRLYGLPMIRLRKALGLTTLQQYFEPPIASGSYDLRCVVSNSLGQTVARATNQVGVGNAAGTMLQLNLTPDCFSANQPVTFEARFANTGDHPISGRIEVHIIDLEGSTSVFQQPFTDLAPGDQASLNEIWTATNFYARVQTSAVAFYDGASSVIMRYHFPSNPESIFPMLPDWPLQHQVPDLIESLFCAPSSRR